MTLCDQIICDLVREKSMVITIKRCPHCSRIYESGPYREKIGKPIVICSSCLKPFRDKNTNEWELLGIGGKIWYVLFVLMSIWVTGIISGMVALLVLLVPDIFLKTNLSGFLIDDKSNGNNFIIFGIVFISLALIYILIREGRDIARSIERMKDSGYRDMLVTAGLLK